jgi:large subunit ribosomal protein L9
MQTTFVLKRRWPPALDKQGTKPKPLKSKNFVYDLVEVQDSKKAPDLKLILTSYVDGTFRF